MGRGIGGQPYGVVRRSDDLVSPNDDGAKRRLAGRDALARLRDGDAHIVRVCHAGLARRSGEP